MPSDSPRNGERVPDLTPFAKTAVRLHPRPGSPSAHESHIGGPLLWPADEPWRYCPGTARNEDVPGVLHVPAVDSAEAHPVDRPMPFAGVAQFFRHDFPKLPFPEGTDLLQVLFCPDPHNGDCYWGPGVQVVWRDSTKVTALLENPPEPFQSDDAEYLPARACSLAPCEVTEYPRASELPVEVNAALPFTNERGEIIDRGAHEAWPAAVTGSKIGGWNYWWTSNARDFPLNCPDCGAGLELLLAFDTLEGPDDDCSCDQPDEGPGWELSDSSVNVFACTADSRHRIRLHAD